MKCPFCNYDDTKVIDSRSQDENTVIRRRRLCENCGKRFTTYEKIDTIPMTVIKNDGTRQLFDRSKVLSGIIKSCNKTSISVKQMEGIVDDVETAIMNSPDKEMASKEIGNLVMDRLKDMDEVAYVRFASVYRQFKDINTFMEELERMLQEKSRKEP